RRDVGPPVKRPTQVVLDGSTEVDILANVPGARVAIWWPTPAFLTTDDGRLDVIANLLSGNRTAWLYWALVDEKRVATAVHTHQYSRALGSVFQVLIEGAPGKSPADILSEFDLAFEGLRKRVVRPKEIDTAVYDYLIDKLLAQDSAATWAYQYTAYEALVGTADYYGHDIDRYSHITPELIHEVIDRWLPSDRRIVLLVTPDPGVVSGGARRGKHFVPAGTP
ncbi:MAG TPA: insulinase family protein, partial [Polyangiaceae bacterium]|nr:insulinase family protein [Polyangiaceae bacterium]